MSKQTCLYLQTGLLSRILHLLERGLAERFSYSFMSSSFRFTTIHCALWEAFSQDHGSEKKVIFDISSRKKQR